MSKRPLSGVALASLRHGCAGTKTHDAWVNIRQRCNNPATPAYAKYGAKGIRVCERWERFENFLADVGEPPSARHTIDRIDPRGHYEPGNVRWATMLVQQNNRTNNRRIEFNGQTRTLMEWSRATGLNHKTISRRIELGWSVQAALTKPADPTAGRFENGHG